MKAAYTSFAKGIALALLFCAPDKAGAQQLPTFLLYREDWALLNPAGLSSNYLLDGKTLTVGASYRRQWAGLEDAPVTGAVQAEAILQKWRVATGGAILNDQTGAFGFTGVYGKFAYLIPMGGRQAQTLSIGLTGGVVQHRVDPGKVEFRDPGDVVAGAAQTSFMPDFGFGAFYHYAERFYAGVSVPQLFGLGARFESEFGGYNIRRVRHFYTLAGAYFNLPYSSAAFLEPSLWLRYVPHAPFSADLNLRYQFNETFWLGAGAGTAKVLHLEFGLTLAEQIHWEKNQIKIGLGFDRYFGAIGTPFGNSYECNLQFAFDR